MSEALVLWGMIFCAASGGLGSLWSRQSDVGQWASTLVHVAGCALGLIGTARCWLVGAGSEIRLPWAIPGGEFHVAIDGLSALFLAPIFLIAGLGSIYGLDYWKQSEHAPNGRKLRLFFGVATAGIALVVIAKNSILFLLGWEAMALASYFLITTDDHDRQAREAGWLYLVATHFAMLCLLAAFALLATASGTFELRRVAERDIDVFTITAIMTLSMIGFGIKAGVMPFHVWLPSAHATAPSHVSALMSGVIIKMGIYGLVRVTALLPPLPLAWGAVLLGLGVISGVLGVAFAIGQHDLKRLLAYHSIENIGIILIGVALAVIGRTLDRVDWIIFGLAGGLLHVWNHGLFKPLLFLGAGAVIHATGTREIDHLGGLAKTMPREAVGFLIGAVAICGLPPLNGFVSEFLIYVGLFRTLGDGGGAPIPWPAFAIPGLALLGAMALACFVKVYGAVFLGTPRTSSAETARAESLFMVAPMAVLVGCCFLIGLAPLIVVSVLSGAIHAWAPEIPVAQGVATLHESLNWIGGLGLLTFAAAAILTVVYLARRDGGTGYAVKPTWGCGYAAPTARMQYTSSSFALMLIGLFGWVLRPIRRPPFVASPFPQPASFHSDVPDGVLEFAVLPAFRGGAWVFSWFRLLQQGSVQAYLLYIFLALLALLIWQ